MKRDPKAELHDHIQARRADAARTDLAKCRKRKKELFDKYHQQRRLVEYAIGGLMEAKGQLQRPGGWCPGAGDEVCTLHIVSELLDVLDSGKLPGQRLAHQGGATDA